MIFVSIGFHRSGLTLNKEKIHFRAIPYRHFKIIKFKEFNLILLKVIFTKILSDIIIKKIILFLTIFDIKFNASQNNNLFICLMRFEENEYI